MEVDFGDYKFSEMKRLSGYIRNLQSGGRFIDLATEEWLGSNDRELTGLQERSDASGDTSSFSVLGESPAQDLDVGEATVAEVGSANGLSGNVASEISSMKIVFLIDDRDNNGQLLQLQGPLYTFLLMVSFGPKSAS